MLHLAVTTVLLFQYSIHGQSSGDIRLVKRRLEIFYNFEWGTVCDDSFGDIDAVVACKQLSYSTGISLGSDVDDGSGRIWLDDVNCFGNERKLIYCAHPGFGVGNCNHNEDVGLYCFNMTEVQGEWSPWTTWSVCSDYRCNGGLQSRSRKCDGPLPSDSSLYCKGTSMEIKPCNTTLCPGSSSITNSDPGNYSLGVVGGVGVSCIIITIVLVLLSQSAFSRWRTYKRGDTHNNNMEESYDDLRINQSTSDYSVYTNQNNETNSAKRESNVPFETYDNLGQDFYENSF
ncbi:scavenger receptor cysteine-rich type 1 protein M130-like isoform X1 [Mytilus californianus]|uniref:scavenger receptor cysteine-rich type 1 protein M130-like isoform X1 n=1 Tax=Mytilus californianus TaxID=6549 RepID=UPI00224733A1|nr:scavenger receptor cysteine-rich type 1 protein M130-like isoform X1 [Mytilus californianus]XP_052085687.1 scavenger receptor cysteine-rich type 1 protein M130-like isoform X1 [Mytilus californianus]